MDMKMKCSVIQDLLPSYVDDICSEDTKELVQEHVAECEQCKAKLEQMKNTEIVAGKASEKQVDYLKKMRSTFARKEGVGKLILLILVGIAYWELLAGPRGLLYYARLFPIVVSALFFCAAILAENYRFSGGKARVAEIAVSGAVFVLIVAFFSYVMLGVVEWERSDGMMPLFAGTPFAGMAANEVGPILVNILRVTALIPVAVLLWNTFGKRKNAYATTLNITTITYIVYANDLLYHMDTPEGVIRWIIEITVPQIALAVAGIVVFALLRKFGRTSEGAEKI